MYIILVYDIKQVGDYARVQRYVYKICKKYLIHIQNSVFEGELTKSQIFALEMELKKYLRHGEDSCLLFTSRNKRWLDKIFITKEVIENEQFI